MALSAPPRPQPHLYVIVVGHASRHVLRRHQPVRQRNEPEEAPDDQELEEQEGIKHSGVGGGGRVGMGGWAGGEPEGGGGQRLDGREDGP